MKTTMVALIVAVLVTAAFPQAPPQDSGAPPVASEPDTRPIGGAEAIGLETAPVGMIVTPALRFSHSSETFNGGRDFDHVATIGGALNISRVRGRQRLAVDYNGGGSFSTRAGQESTSYQMLRLSESTGIGRWTLSLFDSIDYTPESAGSITTGIPDLGPSIAFPTSSAGVSSSLMPGQDIATLGTARVSNSVAGQAQYNFSYRNSLTVGGAFGVLRFIGQDFFDSNQYTGFASLERMLDAHNTAGVRYAYTATTYGHLPVGMHTHSFQATLGRRITNRISANLAVGPQIVSGAQELVGSRTIGWSSNLGITYQRNRYSVGLTASRQTNGGSGVIFGARTDSAMLSASRQWLQHWHTGVNGGYARNVAFAANGGKYILKTIGGSVSRDITSYLSVDLLYSGQYQTTTAPIVSSSILNGWRHSIGIAMQWHPKPLLAR